MIWNPALGPMEPVHKPGPVDFSFPLKPIYDESKPVKLDPPSTLKKSSRPKIPPLSEKDLPKSTTSAMKSLLKLSSTMDKTTDTLNAQVVDEAKFEQNTIYTLRNQDIEKRKELFKVHQEENEWETLKKVGCALVSAATIAVGIATGGLPGVALAVSGVGSVVSMGLAEFGVSPKFTSAIAISSAAVGAFASAATIFSAAHSIGQIATTISSAAFNIANGWVSVHQYMNQRRGFQIKADIANSDQQIESHRALLKAITSSTAADMTEAEKNSLRVAQLAERQQKARRQMTSVIAG